MSDISMLQQAFGSGLLQNIYPMYCNPQNKFCHDCGSKLILIERDKYPRFNEMTGERLMELQCPNAKCRLKCKHDYGFLKWSKKCLTCGWSAR